MPHRHIQTIGHFIAWGSIYGLVLGAICGTLIFPILGTSYSAPYGLGIGLTLGVVVGIGMALINGTVSNAPYDLVRYRRRFTVGVGIFVALGAAFLLTISTQGFLWGPTTEGWFPYFAPSLAGAMFWGGLSSAYATNWYADWYASMITKQKNDLGTEDALVQKYGIMDRLARRMFRPNIQGIVLLLLAGAFYMVALYSSFDRGNPSSLAYSLGYLIQTSVYAALFAFGALVVIVITGGYLILFVSRVFWIEYNMIRTPEQLQNLIRAVVLGFFGSVALSFSLQINWSYVYFGQIVPYTLVGVLLIYGGWRMTDGFGEWYFREEKAKSKPKVEHEGMEEAVSV
jgi:hypothetical protein